MNERPENPRSPDSDGKLTRRLLLRWGAAGTIALAASNAAEASAATATPTAATGATEIGVAGPGEIAFEVVGKVDQKGAALSFYGYLTRAAGLDDALLFTKNVPLGRTETDARFTISGTSTVASRAILDTIFVLDADGTLDIHFNEGGGAKFSSSATFAKGAKVATMTSRAQDTVNVQSPNKAVATGVADLVQTAATSFTLKGKQYQFGHAGLRQLLNFTGEATRSDKVLPASSANVAGYSVVAS
jgi:hypothetical protein